MKINNILKTALLATSLSISTMSFAEPFNPETHNWNNIVSAPIEYKAPALIGQLVRTTLVDEGITGPEVDEAIKSIAANESILHVAMFPLGKQVEMVTGKPYPHLSIHNICDASVAAELADFDNRYTVVLPCRISVVEGKDGRIRMYDLNPDIINMMNLTPRVHGLLRDTLDKIDLILEGAKEGSF
jgi:uncharacterized protein (DUF302 family)